MTEATAAMTMADEVNDHLSSGGTVVVSTMMRHTIYKPKHAGMFSMRDGSLYVQRGRHMDKISTGKRLMVGVRLHG